MVTKKNISDWADYVRKAPLSIGLTALQYVRDYLRYQVFLQHCHCNAPTVDPALNCLHATNITIPSGSGATIALGTVPIEDAVYNTWPIDSSNEQTIRFTQHKVSNQSTSQAINWFVEFQFTTGSWVPVWRGDSFPEGSTSTSQFTLNANNSPMPRNAPLRLRTDFGGAGFVSQLDLCFIPFEQLAPPIPVQPPIPGLPTTPSPTCTTDQLCAVVLQIARDLSRVATQVSDIQAAVEGTDQLVSIGSQPISLEGEATLPVGSRGVMIELTHLGAGVFTSALGRPRGLMRAGSIRWGDGEGYSKRQFIDAEDFSRLRPQGALSVSWQLINECSGTLHFLG